jgi:hypothetical protein
VTTRRTYRHTTEEEEDEYDEAGAATVAVVATISDQSPVCWATLLLVDQCTRGMQCLSWSMSIRVLGMIEI